MLVLVALVLASAPKVWVSTLDKFEVAFPKQPAQLGIPRDAAKEPKDFIHTYVVEGDTRYAAIAVKVEGRTPSTLEERRAARPEQHRAIEASGMPGYEFKSVEHDMQKLTRVFFDAERKFVLECIGFKNCTAILDSFRLTR